VAHDKGSRLAKLERFVFLLGGSNGPDLFGATVEQ
jgi:hypothetical protein